MACVGLLLHPQQKSEQNSRKVTVERIIFILPHLRGDSCKESSQQENIGVTRMDVTMEKRPNFLYKILSVEDWAKSVGAVHLPSMDADFIHLSTEGQLDRIVKKYWEDTPEYVVLKVDPTKLSGELVLEANPGGTNKYYHLYHGSIPLSAIVEFEVKDI